MVQGPEHIFLVEDDAGVARLEQRALERAGYRVTTASTPDAALAALGHEGGALVVLDQRLGSGVSGLDLYEQLRAAGHDLPAILVTGQQEDGLLLRALRAGVRDFVPKTPDFLEYLVPAVQRVLRQVRTERQLAAERRQVKLFQAVAAAALRIQTASVPEEILRAVTDEARRVLHAGRALGRLSPTDTPSRPATSVQFDKDGTAQGEHVDLATLTPPLPDPLRAPTTAVRAGGWLAAPLSGAQGRSFGFVALADRAEGEFGEEDEAVLAQLASFAAAALENARLVQELRDADRRKDDFLAMLAHELRNPLAPIRNSLEVIRLRGADRRGSVRQGWDMIERQTEHLARLVDDLLDVSRITRGKITLEKAPIEVAEVVRRALETSRPLIEARRHRLEVRLPSRPVRVEGDLTRLAQVLLNLLNNAAKYTEEGGRITLTVEAPEGDGAGQVVLRVRDTGMGIPREMLPRVFDLFTQVDRTLDRSQGGLGIGLTLVRRLVQMHGGTVQARSDGPGKGSEFIVRLPVCRTAIAAQSQDGHPCLEAVPPRRILVVDDSRDSVQSLAMLLRLVGNEVYTAGDGPSALSLADKVRPEVAILDIGLPGMDGYELARRLRKLPGLERVRLAALTGYGSAADRLRSRDAGFDDHLVKPVELETLQGFLAGLPSTSLPVGQPSAATTP